MDLTHGTSGKAEASASHHHVGKLPNANLSIDEVFQPLHVILVMGKYRLPKRLTNK
jgi:hypothetical protein